MLRFIRFASDLSAATLLEQFHTRIAEPADGQCNGSLAVQQRQLRLVVGLVASDGMRRGAIKIDCSPSLPIVSLFFYFVRVRRFSPVSYYEVAVFGMLPSFRENKGHRYNRTSDNPRLDKREQQLSSLLFFAHSVLGFHWKGGVAQTE